MTHEQVPLFKREISIGDVIALVMSFVAIMVAYGKLDTRVTVVESVQAYQSEANKVFQADIKTSLNSLNEKVSAIADRLPRK